MAFINLPRRFFLSIGSIIIDDIVLHDGRTQMARLGGGSVHACQGMRVWTTEVGLVAHAGQDFPAELRAELAARFDIQGVMDIAAKTVRAWQLIEADGTRTEIFRTGFESYPGLAPRPENIPQAYSSLHGVHLHSSPLEAFAWVEWLRSQACPLILWEPPGGYCFAEQRQTLAELNALVDVFSPNLLEGRAITGKEHPEDVAEEFLRDGVPLVALRMGPAGSLIVHRDGFKLYIPAVQVNPVVDVTGAGNAYCGGLLVGLAQNIPDSPNRLLRAGAMAAVSASFALEQFGALYSVAGIEQRAQQRLTAFIPTIPNPRRPAFDRMASGWDLIPKPPGIEQHINRIAGAGRPDAGFRAGAVVMDIGTGTGGLIPALETVLAPAAGSVLALDLSMPMLVEASRKPADKGRISFLAGDALYLPLAADKLDAVYCLGVFPHFSEFGQTLLELRRVLKPGGRLVIGHAIGRARVNGIHAGHAEKILRTDMLPAATDLIRLLESSGYRLIESEETDAFYLIVSERTDACQNL